MNISRVSITGLLKIKAPVKSMAFFSYLISLAVIASIVLLFSCQREDLYTLAKNGAGLKLNVTAGGGELYLSWEAVPTATSYRVWLNTSDDFSTAAQQGGDLTVTVYTISGLANSTLYYVWIKAFNGTNEIRSSQAAVRTLGAGLYTVSFDGNGNTGGSVPAPVMAAAVLLPDNSVNLLTKIRPSLADLSYSFKGWSETIGGTVLTSPYFPTSDITLYAVWTPCAIGDTGPGGGIIFYDELTYGTYGSWRYLEAAPAGWHIGDPVDPSEIWSNMSSTAIGASAQYTGLGEGLANSNAIISQPGHSSSAAKLCRNYTGGGLFDWYLPSRDELNELNNQRVVVGCPGPSAYWSSSEDTTDPLNYAFNQYFTVSTIPVTNLKSNSAYVRPVRGF